MQSGKVSRKIRRQLRKLTVDDEKVMKLKDTGSRDRQRQRQARAVAGVEA
jgi:hypothetical protein